MEKKNNMSEVISEIKAADEESLQKVIEEWFDKTRTQGLKIGASFISAAVYAAIRKHITMKASKATLRDYRRCIAEITGIVEKQIKTQQNETEVAAVQQEEQA
jgi:IS5 family transposase